MNITGFTRPIFCLVLAISLGLASATAAPGIAKVLKVTGQVTATTGGAAPVAVVEGMELGGGATLQTAADSNVQLDLGVSGELLRLDASTTLKIDTLEVNDPAKRVITTQLTVSQGTVAGAIAKKLAPGSKYEVTTPAGVARITGTKWMLVIPPGLTQAQALARNAFNFVVTEGTVTFTGPNGTPVTISAANGPVVYAYNTSTGQTETQPLAGATVVNPVTGQNTTISSTQAGIITRDLNTWIQSGGAPNGAPITIGTSTVIVVSPTGSN